MDALNNENLDTQGQVNNNVGQDEGSTHNEESETNWEEQAKYFQSEKDKLHSENQNLKKYEKIGQFLESRPDIVESIQNSISSNGQSNIEQNRISLKADEFDPWEAYNDPASKSYQFRQQELASTINEQVEKKVADVKSQVGMNQLHSELDKRGLTAEQKESFVKFASTSPADHGIDGVLKMWQAMNGEPEQVQEDNQPSNPFDSIRQNQTAPQQGGVLNGQQPVRKSDKDSMWDTIMKSGSRTNVLK